MSPGTQQTPAVDAVDRKILQALQISPRLPFALLAQVLDLSEQTVARRYRRLHREGVMRVTAVVNPAPLGQSNWLMRVQCRPSGAGSLAQALARRDDVSWVSLVGGGAEVVCILRARTQQARDDLLIERLPRTTQVLGMSAAVVLHRFGADEDEWSGLDGNLTPEQEAAVREWVEPSLGLLGRVPSPANASGEPDRPRLIAGDLAMLGLLVADGRATYTALAAAADTTQGRAVRRLRSLLADGVAYLDVDFAMRTLGYACQAVLWLTVAPADLEPAGQRLSSFAEVVFTGAITGAHNLSVTVVCRDLAALYAFVTEKVSTVDGVHAMEVSPVLRVVKQAGAMLVDDLLAG
ncbi:Lrp/AsnC family transcriptional regulator [uncultured Jatrophihabitans sp.]|uniref:Lrp/AsnC family transcriptional regulator n=1 Tax=uncultured Jatrophihabitans sp. TaxID=1610747 RepID=UPI0035CA8E77